MKWISAFLIWVSIVEWVAAALFGWVNSVAYVSHLSQLAIVISLVPYWQGCRIEARQADADVAGDVVSAIVEETTVNKI